MFANKRLWALVGVAAVLAVTVGVLLLARPEAVVPLQQATTPVPAVTAAYPSPPVASPGVVAPPWTLNPPSGASPGAVSGTTPSAGTVLPQNSGASVRAAPETLREVNALRQSIAASMQSGQPPDIKKVEELLLKLKQQYGSTVSGVNIDAVLSNLRLSVELQGLALEMQREVSKPGGGDKNKISAYSKQLSQLQSRLRNDVMAPTKSTVTK